MALDKNKALDILNGILELELAGVVRYTHYSFMIFGHARIPIIAWMRKEAAEAVAHAHAAGELITAFGGHPSLKIGKLLETHRHDIDDILREAIEHENGGIKLYRDLLAMSQDVDIRLEEYAREMIRIEEDHVSEIEKMLRRPGVLEVAH